MKPTPQSKPLGTVGTLLRERMRETGRSSRELAEAAEVPAGYIEDLISGRRRPPLPNRTDVYDKLTRCLRLGRGHLAACASAQRADAAPGGGPNPAIRRSLLALCEPETARELERRARRGNPNIVELIARLLSVVQSSARRTLEDQIALRISATQGGTSYAEVRLRVLEFLDATLDTLTAADVADFVRPRIALWDADLDTGVLRVVLRAHETPERDRRRPVSRSEATQ